MLTSPHRYLALTEGNKQHVKTQANETRSLGANDNGFDPNPRSILRRAGQSPEGNCDPGAVPTGKNHRSTGTQETWSEVDGHRGTQGSS
jgi:hypothetical protein